MSQNYADLTLFQAKDLADNTKADAIRSIIAGTNIKLDYCIPKKFSKRRTDVSAAETEAEAGPDTGPSGKMVEIKVTLDRSAAEQQTFLNTLLFWEGLSNTPLPFKRGFLGLENSDNPSLNLDPEALLGYKLLDFGIINPSDFKGTQEYLITIQMLGSTLDLPAIAPMGG